MHKNVFVSLKLINAWFKKKKTKDRNDEKLPNEHPVIGLQNSIGH